MDNHSETRWDDSCLHLTPPLQPFCCNVAITETLKFTASSLKILGRSLSKHPTLHGAHRTSTTTQTALMTNSHSLTNLPPPTATLDKLDCVIVRDGTDGRHLASVKDDSEVVVCTGEQLRAKGSNDELRMLGQFSNHGCEKDQSVLDVSTFIMPLTSNGSTTISVQIRINLVKQVEWRWIALLDGENHG